MKNQFALIKNGYVRKDLTEVEPKLINRFPTRQRCEKALKNYCIVFKCDESEFHTIEVFRALVGWREVEGSEKFYNSTDR
jgi:hypothetical protein